MKLGRLNHIGVATPSIENAIEFYREVMGATHIGEPFDLPEQGVKVCFVSTPSDGAMLGTQIELIEPLDDKSPITSFLIKNPSGGQHHICFEVEEINSAILSLKKDGATILGDGKAKIGAHGKPVIFLHPKHFLGTLIELEEV